MHYIQAIPEINIFTNLFNDVLRYAHSVVMLLVLIVHVDSFYKEEMDGEQHNYIQMMSRVSGLQPLDVLRATSHKAVSTAKRAEAILEDSPAALKALKEYKRGFMYVTACSFARLTILS